MNILIRPLEIEDAAVSYKWRNDPEIWKFTGSKPSQEITEVIEKEWLSNSLTDKTKSRFAIVVDNVYVGNVQLTNIIDKKSAEFHIFIGEKSFWGKGIASQATYQLLVYAKEILGLKEVNLEVKNENFSAIKSYEKNGFIKVCEKNDSLSMKCLLTTLLPPTVSIFCMVYNHENYLKETLDGFLMQKTNFNTLIIIGEDCSTDNSRKILLDYSNKYPGKFKLLLHESNIGANANQKMVLENCNGKYISFCEGDDYWTDPLKLQKQVDFLETHPDYNVAVGKYKFYYEKSKQFKDSVEAFNVNKELTVENYIAFNFSHTSTFLIRKLDVIPDWFADVFAGDQSLMIVAAGEKKIKYFDEFFSVYRINEHSVTANMVKKDPAIAYNNTNRFLNYIDKHTAFKYSNLISKRKKLNMLFFKMDGSTSKLQRFWYKGLIYLYRTALIKSVK